MAATYNNDLPLHPRDRKKIDEGRGQGTGPGYEPFVKIHEISSKGRKGTVYGWKSKRVHHPLSLGEQAVTILADADPDVDEIFDQKLIPFEESVSIANTLQIQHPWDGHSHLYACTIDFLIRRINGEHFGRSFKMSEELDDNRVLAKLQIERTWFERKRAHEKSGWDWGIVTERNIDSKRVSALINLNAYRDPSQLTLSSADIETVRVWSEQILSSSVTFAQMAQACEHSLELEPKGVVLQCYRHFIALGRWRVDLSQGLDMDRLLQCRKTQVFNDVTKKYELPTA